MATHDQPHASTADIKQLKIDALKSLVTGLAHTSEASWLESARGLILQNDFRSASVLLRAAIGEHPGSMDLRRSLAGAYLQTGFSVKAEEILRSLLSENSGDASAAFLLARSLLRQGRTQAMASVLMEFFWKQEQTADPDTTIAAVELLDEAGKQFEAAAICERQIEKGSTDARLHAYAGMLHIQLGQFEVARQRYLYSVNDHRQAFEWNTAIGLSSLQRYSDPIHADLAMFRTALNRPDQNEHARASLLFALGKAHDDLADYAQAAKYLSEANALVNGHSPWSRKIWRNAIVSRLAAKPRSALKDFSEEWAPLFIVGVPRSGTTLIAELLSRHRDVCNRGELPWLAKVARDLELSGHTDIAALQKARSTYEAHLLQDDESGAKWFIDKEPMNLLRIDLIIAMYPNAKVIFCERNPRDTAISLWSQYFSGGSQGYAYDLSNIRAVLDGCNKMKRCWLSRYPEAMRVIQYEAFVSNSASVIEQLAQWLNLSTYDHLTPRAAAPSSIATASLWQARQPVYMSSVGRWRHYAAHLPDLLKLPEA